MKLAARLFVLALALLAGLAPADVVTKVPPYDQFLVVPLRVHVVVSPEYPMTNTQIKDAEVLRSLAEINAIWSKAGVMFGLDSIVREPAGQLDRFKLHVRRTGGQFTNTDPFAMLLPRGPSRAFDGVHLFIVHELSTLNGFYIPAADAALTVEKPGIRQVEGGSKDALARVAARFLGEAIGLPESRDDEFGLASGGTNGVALDEGEIAQVRQVAPTIPGVLKVAGLMKEADAAIKRKDVETARRAYTWLTQVPGAGTGAAEARKQLSALPPAAKK